MRPIRRLKGQMIRGRRRGVPMACVHGCTHVAECVECTAPPLKGKLRRTIVNDLNTGIDLSGGWYDRGYRKGYAHTGVDGFAHSKERLDG